MDKKNLSKVESGSYQSELSSTTQPRTCLEKFLILFLAFAIVAVIVLAVLLSQSATPTEEICLTKECAAVAAQLTSSIDYDVEPCDNFYDFACGMWMKRHVVPDDRSNLYTYGVLRDQVSIIVKYLIEDTKNDHIEAVRKARDFYESCMNETRIEELDTSEALDILHSLGGWPTLGNKYGGNWNESKFDLVSDIVMMRRYSAAPFINMYVSTDDKKLSERIIRIDQAVVGMRNRNFLLSEKYKDMRNAYIRYGKNVATLLGADQEAAETDMADILSLEIKLANISLSKSERRNVESLYNKMTLDELIKRYPGPDETHTHAFNWLSYVQSMIDLGEDNVTINETEPVILVAPKYYEKIFEVLTNETRRTLKNFMMWAVVRDAVSLLPHRFADKLAEYKKATIGKGSKESRWKTCSKETVKIFGLAIGRLFVEETFDEEAKSYALEMIHDIREAFYETLEELDWMDIMTKGFAMDKAISIDEKIGYPDHILNDTSLNDYYDKFEIQKDAYFMNNVEIAKVVTRSAYKGLRKPTKKDKARYAAYKGNSDYAPSTVNAFYSPLRNQILFPAGILQAPYYNKHQPSAMNYGSIGWLIGHEITHAFDDLGRKFDKDGHLRQWWSKKATKKFNEKTKCFIDQYSQFIQEHTNLPLDGVHTLGENIADNGGLRQSYKAYLTWLKRHKEKEIRLPGVNFTNKQLFFINFAQGWCGVATKQYAIDQVHTDVHSPGRFRVIGSLQNSVDFSETFSCPEGSYMNPTNKCQIW